MVSKRATKKFGGLVYYLAEREMSQTAATMEAKRLRKDGYLARVVQLPGRGLSVAGKFAVYFRKSLYPSKK